MRLQRCRKPGRAAVTFALLHVRSVRLLRDTKLAKEVAAVDIRVNAASPGIIYSDYYRDYR